MWDNRVGKSVSYMLENLDKDFSLIELARFVNTSQWHLIRLFNKDTGKSPIQYLKLLRMKQATNLLVSSSTSIKQIAHIVGFTDVSHFVRDFKTIYGLRPTQYRLNNKIANRN